MSKESTDPRVARAERLFEKPLLAAAVLSIPATILESTRVGEPWQTIGTALNWIIWTAFLAELVTMLVLVRQRGCYLLGHPLEIAIVVLTPPFLIGAVQGVRALRLLRLMRVLRLKPLAERLFSLEGVSAAGSLAVLVAVAGGGGFAAEEGVPFGDGVYWAISTMTTVGYGDIAPHSSTGKVIAVITMLVGIGTAALAIGAVAQRFVAPEEKRSQLSEDKVLSELRDLTARLGRLELALREGGGSSARED